MDRLGGRALLCLDGQRRGFFSGERQREWHTFARMTSLAASPSGKSV